MISGPIFLKLGKRASHSAAAQQHLWQCVSRHTDTLKIVLPFFVSSSRRSRREGFVRTASLAGESLYTTTPPVDKQTNCFYSLGDRLQLQLFKATITRIRRSKWNIPEKINVISPLYFVLCRQAGSRYTKPTMNLPWMVITYKNINTRAIQHYNSNTIQCC